MIVRPFGTVLRTHVEQRMMWGEGQASKAAPLEFSFWREGDWSSRGCSEHVVLSKCGCRKMAPVSWAVGLKLSDREKQEVGMFRVGGSG